MTTPTTGEIIRAALTAQGITHRTGEGAVERGWLATTGHDGPTVYVTGHDTNGCMDYDHDPARHLTFAATVTTTAGTSLVYYQRESDDLTPEADAEACAAAVAAYLHPTRTTTTQPEPQCPECNDHGQVDFIDENERLRWVTCTVPACVQRAKANGRRYEERRQIAARIGVPDTECPPF